jgi:hypothetical protein
LLLVSRYHIYFQPEDGDDSGEFTQPDINRNRHCAFFALYRENPYAPEKIRQRLKMTPEAKLGLVDGF